MDHAKPNRFCPQCGTAVDPAVPGCTWCAALPSRKRRPLLVAGGIVLLLGAGALLLPRAPGISLLQEGVFARHDSVPLGAPLTTAPAPAAPPAPGHAVLTAHPPKHKRAPAVVSTPGQPEPLAPSILIGADSRAPENQAPSVVAAPARPDTPLAPPVVAAPAAPAPPQTASLIVTGEPASPPPSKGTLLENGWLERPGDQENPEIIIHNEAGRSAVVLARGRGKTYRWIIGPKGLRETLLPGTYRYELHEEIYEKTGRPDQIGSLTCGQYKVYELTYWHRFSGFTHVEDIGDQGR